MTIYRRPDPIPIKADDNWSSEIGFEARRKSLHWESARRIFAIICSGEFSRPGVLPNELELCEMLDVSRTVVREAIKTLEAKNVVQARRKLGTLILPKNSWSAVDQDLLKWQIENGDLELLESIEATLMSYIEKSATITTVQKSFSSETPRIVELASVGDYHRIASIYVSTMILGMGNSIDRRIFTTLAGVRIASKEPSKVVFTTVNQLEDLPEAIVRLGQDLFDIADQSFARAEADFAQ